MLLYTCMSLNKFKASTKASSEASACIRPEPIMLLELPIMPIPKVSQNYALIPGN